MPSIDVLPASAVFAANGGTDGTIQVASTTGFFAYAEAFLSDTTGRSQRCIITRIVDSTHIQVRPIASTLVFQGSSEYVALPGTNYTVGGDVSAFTTANTARIDMLGQVVRVDQPTYTKRNVV